MFPNTPGAGKQAKSAPLILRTTGLRQDQTVYKLFYIYIYCNHKTELKFKNIIDWNSLENKTEC